MWENLLGTRISPTSLDKGLHWLCHQKLWAASAFQSSQIYITLLVWIFAGTLGQFSEMRIIFHHLQFALLWGMYWGKDRWDDGGASRHTTATQLTNEISDKERCGEKAEKNKVQFLMILTDRWNCRLSSGKSCFSDRSKQGTLIWKCQRDSASELCC